MERRTHVYVGSRVTVDTTGDTVALAVSKNGTVQSESEMRVTGSNAVQSFLSAGSLVRVTTGDQIETQIKNVDTTSDLPVSAFTTDVTGAN